MLSQSYPNYKTVHRRFQTWCCHEILRLVLTDVANELRENGALDDEECFIDATVVMAKWRVGNRTRSGGMKIWRLWIAWVPLDHHARCEPPKAVRCSCASTLLIDAKRRFDRRSRTRDRW